jgi:hypothetical protein
MKYISIDIDWTVFLNTTTEAKARNVIKKMEDALGLNLSSHTMERYWKQNDLFKVSATSHVDGLSPRNAFYNIMKRMKPIANRWVVTLPEEEGPFEFGGSANAGEIGIQGIHSVSFNISELPQSRKQQ